MALKLAQEVKNTGIQADYFRIAGLSHSRDEERTTLHLKLYASTEARQAGKEPIDERSVKILETPTAPADYVAAYVLLKGTDEFSSAEDV